MVGWLQTFLGPRLPQVVLEALIQPLAFGTRLPTGFSPAAQNVRRIRCEGSFRDLGPGATSTQMLLPLRSRFPPQPRRL